MTFGKEMKNLVSLLVGVCFGSFATFMVMRGSHEKSQSQNTAAKEAGSVDPFSNGSDGDFGEHSEERSIGDKKMDMNDPQQRDICISLWYMDMISVVDNLERRTGHIFDKELGKVYASPMEILQEQAVFMGNFHEESERLRTKQQTKKPNKAEMATPMKLSD
jgi:hypothetical protein